MRFKNKTLLGVLAIIAICGVASSAQAGMVNITVADGRSGATFAGSSFDGITGEDNETEPGTQQAQSWDLERVVWNQTTKDVSIIGGFDFLSGNSGFHSGDIFIDVNGSFQTLSPNDSSNGYETINGNMGYEYVIHFSDRNPVSPYNLSGLGYEVYRLDGSSVQLKSGYYESLSSSSPFIYQSGGTLLASGLTAGMNTYTSSAAVNGAYDDASGWVDVKGYGGNDTHYDLTVDIGWLAYERGISPDTLHMTLGCGNDEIRGQFATGALIQTPDGGMTVMLLGISLTSLAFIRRRIAA